jgi:stage II sporulation protein D
VRIGDGRSDAVWTLDEEEYVAAVTAAETEGDWPLEALKAQAVVVRTFLEKNRGRHAKDGYDLCNLAHCQVYRGPAAPRSAARAAALATRGEILTRNGRPVDAFFHSSCGGRTAAARDVWGPSAQDLPGVSDEKEGGAWCGGSPDFAWTAAIDETGLQVLMRPEWEIPAEGEARIVRRDASGRVTGMILTAGGKSYRMSGDALLLSWGRMRRWHRLRSAKFDVERRGRGTLFRGRGLGHGVGLCQWGARGLAEEGYGWKEILSHYFPTAEARRLD